MIVTILPSSPTFHAVLYNEKKVAQGSAQLLEIKNFGHLEVLGYEKPSELQQYLIDYSARNSRIKQPQLHLAVSCRGHEHTETELLEFAHTYLDKMGYGDPAQPLLVYAHRDTDNTHLHIITSRVAPNGKKINDSKERVRSQKVIEDIMSHNIKQSTEDFQKVADSYSFTDMRQYKSIWESMNYTCFETPGYNGNLCLKKNGQVVLKIPKKEILRKAAINSQKAQDTPAHFCKIRKFVKDIHETSFDRNSFEETLLNMYNMSVIWLGPRDKPFGYHIVDHRSKKVYAGRNILNLKDMLRFKDKESFLKDVGIFIDNCFKENPYISTRELNARLRKEASCYVKKGIFHIGKTKAPFTESYYLEALKRNDKIAWLNKFSPASEDERAILCMLTKFDAPEMVRIVETAPNEPYKIQEVERIYHVLKTAETTEDKLAGLEKIGYRLTSYNGRHYLIDMKNNSIIDLSLSRIPDFMYRDILPLRTPSQSPAAREHTHRAAAIPHIRTATPARGSGSTNREWEVGRKERDRDDQDNRKDMSY